jgi:hypothetical protein
MNTVLTIVFNATRLAVADDGEALWGDDKTATWPSTVLLIVACISTVLSIGIFMQMFLVDASYPLIISPVSQMGQPSSRGSYKHQHRGIAVSSHFLGNICGHFQCPRQIFYPRFMVMVVPQEG